MRTVKTGSGQRQFRGSWWADNSKWPGSPDISNGLSDNFRRVVRSQIYLGPDTRGFSSADDVRIDGFLDISKEEFPEIGDEYGIWYFDNADKQDYLHTWRIMKDIDIDDRHFDIDVKGLEGLTKLKNLKGLKGSFLKDIDVDVKGLGDKKAIRIEVHGGHGDDAHGHEIHGIHVLGGDDVKMLDGTRLKSLVIPHIEVHGADDAEVHSRIHVLKTPHKKEDAKKKRVKIKRIRL